MDDQHGISEVDGFLAVTTFASDLGWMAALGSGQTLARLTFGHANPQAALRALPADEVYDARITNWWPALVERITAYAAGDRIDFSDVHISEDHLTPFQQRVIRECRAIPFGERRTYGELAEIAGSPRAARAVGSVMAKNRVAIVVPCHRVVSSSGTGGYSAGEGTRTKLRLLEAEAVAAG